MNYSSSSHISPSGISSDLYPPDLQSLHIHSSQGLECLTGTASLLQSVVCTLLKTIGFLLISFHQLQSISPSHWWRQWPVIPFIVPGSVRIKVKKKKRERETKPSVFPFKPQTYSLQWISIQKLISSGPDHNHHHQQFYRGDKPPRQEQTDISYLMFLIWRK